MSVSNYKVVTYSLTHTQVEVPLKDSKPPPPSPLVPDTVLSADMRDESVPVLGVPPDVLSEVCVHGGGCVNFVCVPGIP